MLLFFSATFLIFQYAIENCKGMITTIKNKNKQYLIKTDLFYSTSKTKTKEKLYFVAVCSKVSCRKRSIVEDDF